MSRKRKRGNRVKMMETQCVHAWKCHSTTIGVDKTHVNKTLKGELERWLSS